MSACVVRAGTQMHEHVVRLILADNKVGGPVVRAVSVDVVDCRWWGERLAQRPFGDQHVLFYVSGSRCRARVAGALEHGVPALDRAPSLPGMMPLPAGVVAFYESNRKALYPTNLGAHFGGNGCRFPASAHAQSRRIRRCKIVRSQRQHSNAGNGQGAVRSQAPSGFRLIIPRGSGFLYGRELGRNDGLTLPARRE